MSDEATDANGTVEAPDGIDQNPLEDWFGANVPGVELPLRFERIAGGHSNLTYRVTDTAGTKWALRRPPLGKRLGSAHDMAREHKVVSALGGPRCRWRRWSASARTRASTTRPST